MPLTDFDDLLEQKGSAALEAKTRTPLVSGSPIVADEVRARLSPQLYNALADGSDNSVIRASERAVVHVSAVLARLGNVLDLNSSVSREIVLLFTVYELHLALGHEEAGREYRIKAKDLIIAAFGDYPEGDKPALDKVAAGAITIPARKPFP